MEAVNPGEIIHTHDYVIRLVDGTLLKICKHCGIRWLIGKNFVLPPADAIRIIDGALGELEDKLQSVRVLTKRLKIEMERNEKPKD